MLEEDLGGVGFGADSRLLRLGLLGLWQAVLLGRPQKAQRDCLLASGLCTYEVASSHAAFGVAQANRAGVVQAGCTLVPNC